MIAIIKKFVLKLNNGKNTRMSVYIPIADPMVYMPYRVPAVSEELHVENCIIFGMVAPDNIAAGSNNNTANILSIAEDKVGLIE